MMQYQLSPYLNYVFEPFFDNSTRIWRNAPTHRVIYSLIRRKPRDMVKLCQSAAEEAYNRHLDKINATCFINILENYSQERLKDLINEYKSQPYGLTTGSAGGLDEPLRGIFRYRL